MALLSSDALTAYALCDLNERSDSKYDTGINIYFCEWNPNGEHLHSFTLCTHTLLICFSLSPFIFIISRLSFLRTGMCLHAILGCDQMGDGRVLYQSPYLFWKAASGSGDQMQKQRDHWGRSETAAAGADSAHPTLQSWSALCLGDMCFPLYVLQLGLCTMIEILVFTKERVLYWNISVHLCTSGINIELSNNFQFWHAMYKVGVGVIIQMWCFD